MQTDRLFRVPKNQKVQFQLGSVLGKVGKFYTNYPPDDKYDRFYREQFNVIPVMRTNDLSDCTDLYVEIKFSLPGSFAFKYISDDEKSSLSGYFLVDPELKIKNDQTLRLDCIQCQTVLAKNLNRFETWEKKLLVAKECGYNMIHFTPIQELGDSNSAYCIKDQLSLNEKFFDKKDNKNLEKIKTFLEKMRRDWGVLSICDIVLNHTANESPWLQIHPEASYNCFNCPYLKPAYLLDAALYQFSMEVKEGTYEVYFNPPIIETEDHLNDIRFILHTQVLPKLALSELYLCDVNKLVEEFRKLIRSENPQSPPTDDVKLVIIQDPKYRRVASKVDMKLALKLFNNYRNDAFDEDTRIQKCMEAFKSALDSLNSELEDKLKNHLIAAVENVIASIRYYRVQEDGPKHKEISEKTPLIYRYFTDYGNPKFISQHEDLMNDSKTSKFLMAHNGWVMNANPLENFAEFPANVYIRRELIAWGDSVKLRYGKSKSDSEFLWDFMREYVVSTAAVFDGVRLDNCHSTPLHVAEYLLDEARKVNPNLYVVAELFTNSDQLDNVFVNRLGITTLIRESMSAWDSHEEGRLVYRYGGEPLGVFFQPSSIMTLKPTIAHAIFFDATHDNPSPIEKRSVYDLLPSAAIVSMACCATGSNRGYDELVPHHIHVVEETREYAEFSKSNKSNGCVNLKSGILMGKKLLNDLHYYLGSNGFTQVFVDQIDSDVVAITRHNPQTQKRVLLIAFTAFKEPEISARYIKPLEIEGVIEKVLFECKLVKDTSKESSFVKDKKVINGLSEFYLQTAQNIDINESEFLHVTKNKKLTIEFRNFLPGSVVAIEFASADTCNFNSLHKFIELPQEELKNILEGLSLKDFNTLMFRCDAEERSDGFNRGVYEVPNFGPMVYCGLQGTMSLLSVIRPINNLGHPLCENIRQGDWLMEYTIERLSLQSGTKKLSEFLRNEILNDYSQLLTFLKPAYFDAIITKIYTMALKEIFAKMSTEFIDEGSTFIRALALASLQFAAFIKDAQLPTLSPKLELSDEQITSLAAGLPHFATGYMRNWGRDTFIALRGIFLLTGRHQEARLIILAYAGCLRHGLIPNLLDGGVNARYNCRDAVWWWLQSIKCFVEDVPQGWKILNDPVSRLYPTDDSDAQTAGRCDQNLAFVMQEALNVHFQGLAFRERNAGQKIDELMTDKGFNNQIGVNPVTGFVFGGNEYNCGTWMDKMGSSLRACNKGQPATPRDGSAVELVGLSKSVISWLAKLYKDDRYPYNGVERIQRTTGVTIKWTFDEWAERIQQNFEKYFWIDPDFKDQLKNRCEIYKDSFGASRKWTDYQLRCNFPIAMVVAPELFDPEHAWRALKMVETHLLSPLGLKTLDSSDWNYCGDYDNSNDSTNRKVAHGFNYHQGPEWLWPVGFYLRAKLIFGARLNKLEESIEHVNKVLANHLVELQSTSWKGLPELTNTNGAYCKDGSRTQAWSVACIQEVLYDLFKHQTKSK